MIDTHPETRLDASFDFDDERSDARPAPTTRPTFRSRWGWEVALIGTLAGLLPLLAANAYRSLGQPTSDDWSYLTSLAHLTQHGAINFNHWGTVFELGQLVLTSPLYLIFGVHPVLAVLWVWAVGMGGLFGVAYLGRRCAVPRGVVLLLITALIACPLFFQMNTTFMTDVPSFSFMVIALCLWIDCRSSTRFEARRWAALVVATLAFTIREPAALVALPILFEPLLAAHRRGDLVRRRRYFIGAAAWVTALGALWVWRQGIASSGWEPPLHFTPAAFILPWVTGWLPTMLGLFLLPVVLTLSPWNLVPHLVRQHRRAALIITLIVLVVPTIGLWALTKTKPWALQLGNYVSIDHFMPLTYRIALSMLGLVSLAVAALVMYGGWHARHTLPVTQGRAFRGLNGVILSYAAFIVGTRLYGVLMWDRYWLIVLALGGIVLSQAGTAVRQSVDLPSTRVGLRRGAIAASIILVGFYGASVFTDTSAQLAGEYNFATEAVGHLPAGFGAQDIMANWLWDGTTYTMTPGMTSALTSTGSYAFSSHDSAGSYMFVYGGYVGTCAPFAVETRYDLQGDTSRIVEVGPASHGLFVSFQFLLAHQSLKECINVAHSNHINP